jgi:probable phosphoglycerate mutase
MTTQTNESEAAAKLPALYLIRHGETAWSLSGQHTGRTDLPLLPSGVEQARRLAPRLRHVTFNQVLSSPRLRARETCALAGLGESPEIAPDLAEWDYGDYEGLLSREIQQRQPGWNIYRDGCPNGESPAQISDRADRLIARLRELRGNVALFSHGHFSRVLAVRWVRLPVSAASHLLINTASLSILTFEQSLTRPVIALWNWRSEP